MPLPFDGWNSRAIRTRVVAGIGSCVLAAALAAEAGAQGSGAPETGGVAGTVRDAGGAPVFGAEARSGRAGPVRTDTEGRFELRGVAAGSAVVEVRRLGFEPAVVRVQVPRGGVVRVDVRLTSAATALDPVRVTGRPEAFAGRLAGFNTRRRQGRGHFIGRERIEQSASRSVIDLIRTAPGVRIGRTGTIGSVPAVRFRGSNCPPLVFIDGFPATAGEFDLGTLELQSIEGIEMYASLASVPPELLGPRGLDRCGVIGIWTRPLRARAATREERVPPPSALPSGVVFSADSVDVPVGGSAHAVSPVFPESLWKARVGGRVVAEYVVDSTGAVETNSIVIVSSSSPLLSDAVRDALVTAQFEPAMRGGRAVRQLVHQAFEFRAAGRAADRLAGSEVPAGA